MKGKKKRPFIDLETKAMSGLRKVESSNLEHLVDFALTLAPSAIIESVRKWLTSCGFAGNEADVDVIAKSTRWLSIILRDYGKESFQATVEEIKKVSQQRLFY